MVSSNKCAARCILTLSSQTHSRSRYESWGHHRSGTKKSRKKAEPLGDYHSTWARTSLLTATDVNAFVPRQQQQPPKISRLQDEKKRVKNHHHTHQRNDFESSLQTCKEVLKNGGSRRRKRSAKSKLERLLLASRLNIAWSANSNTEFEGTAEEKTIDVGGHRRGGLRAEVVKVRRVWSNQLKFEHFI